MVMAPTAAGGLLFFLNESWLDLTHENLTETTTVDILAKKVVFVTLSVIICSPIETHQRVN